MPLLSSNEVVRLKIKSLPLADIRVLAFLLKVSSKGSVDVLCTRILESTPDEGIIDQHIKLTYLEKIKKRKKGISDEDLKSELMKVQTFNWGVVQGELDQKIQREYVRKTARYDELRELVEQNLVSEVTDYVTCSWFNHWTTQLIEDHISSHVRVVPTVKDIKGTDIFFDGQPFDLKTTYLPRSFDPNIALRSPSELAVWLYQKQGLQRFGADNRFFVILMDETEPQNSWQLKRNFDLVFRRIDEFLDGESVSCRDEISFCFRKQRHTALSKVLIITKSRLS